MKFGIWIWKVFVMKEEIKGLVLDIFLGRLGELMKLLDWCLVKKESLKLKRDVFIVRELNLVFELGEGFKEK